MLFRLNSRIDRSYASDFVAIPDRREGNLLGPTEEIALNSLVAECANDLSLVIFTSYPCESVPAGEFKILVCREFLPQPAILRSR